MIEALAMQEKLHIGIRENYTTQSTNIVLIIGFSRHIAFNLEFNIPILKMFLQYSPFYFHIYGPSVNGYIMVQL
jgi:hypothetical protein